MKKEILYRFFEGNCTQNEVREVRDWIESSPENKKLFFQESRVYDAIDLLATERELPVSKPKLNTSFWSDLVKIAATVAIVLSVVGIWNYSKEPKQQAMNIIQVPAGKNASVVLPDGSSVWLNARTKIEYPSSFEKGSREILLDGEAYFEISHDSKKPFIVRTKTYNVEVLGTKFNVQAYSFGDKIVTSLMEGAVKLTAVADEANSFLLKPNQLAYIENGEFISEPIKDYNPYRWKEGLICFDNISFPEIMREFEKYYEVEIVIENEKVRDYLCTGKFRQSDGVEYALKILQKDVAFNYERAENSPVIYIK